MRDDVPQGWVQGGRGSLAALLLVCLSLAAASAQAQEQGSTVRRSDGEVIQKLPCRISKYSDKPVCPAMVLRAPAASATALGSSGPVSPPVAPAVAQRAAPQPVAVQAAKAKPAASRTVAAVAKPVPVLSVEPVLPLSPDLLAIAEQVERGSVSCEFGAVVTVSEVPDAPGYFTVSGRQFRFRMAPVMSSTGAIRLEDQAAGAVWLQLPEKSMLMSQRQGIRLADACVTPMQAQAAFANSIHPKPGLLDVQPQTQALVRADR
jgi:hypothetical protein